MTKKSLAIVFTSLIIGGLFFVGNANAMTYTVSGSSTNIRIPEDRAGTIKRCETCDPVTFNKANCNTDSNCENSDRMLKYNHQYSVSSGYKITFELNNLNTGYLENLYLNNANLIEITGFSPLTTINNLYLDNNREIKLSNNQFNNITIRSLHIDESYLNNFLPDLNNIEKIYLRDNNLETIPAKIRDNRLYYKIYLSNNIRIGNSNTREVYLNNIINGEPDNKIIFIGITKCNDDSDTNNCSFRKTTSYKFERFGFHYNNSNLTYDYKIYTRDNEDDVKSYENDYGSTSKVVNDTSLKPGNYTFKVCLHGDNTNCDTVDFSVDYNIDLEFTHTPESTVYSTDNICFYWDKYGSYPNEYIAGYTYSLYPGNLNVATPVDTTNYCIEDLPSNPNGDYTFYVYLINTDGDEIATSNYSFTIAINNDITINEPSSSPYSSQGSNKTSVPFDWETESTLFHHYNYYVTTDSSCSNNNKVLSENGITSKHPSFSEDLGNGSYTLCIDMFDSLSNKLGDTAYRSFSVSTAPTLQISSPISGSTVSTATTTFSRNGFVPDPYTLSNYTYTVTGTNYTTGGTTNNTSFSISNLSDGTYTFTITMNYNDGSNKTLTKAATFTINASAGKNLTITSPISGHIYYPLNLEKTVSIPFTWIGTGSTLIENFSYILTNTTKNQQITGGTITKNNSGYYQIPNRELSGGTYKFEVKMLDSYGGSIEEKSHNFSVTIPTYLTIISPIPNSNGVLSGKKDINFSRYGFSEFDQLYDYKYKLEKTKDGTTTTINSGTMKMVSKAITGFNMDLQNGHYKLTVYMMSGQNDIITSETKEFTILDTIDMILSISDGSGSWHDNNSKIIIETGNLIFNWEGQSEDLSGFYYSITGTNFKNEPFEYTGTLYGSTTGSVTLTGLISGKYRFFVNMLNGNGGSIISGSLDFEIAIPSSLKIQYPADGSTVNSSSVTFSWTAESDILRTGFSENLRHYEYQIIKVTASGNEQVLPRQITNANSFTYNFSQDGTYKLGVQLYSGGTSVARDYSTFTISIPRSSGGGGYSSKSHPTNNLDIYIKNESPDTNEWIEVVITIDDKYTGKVDFTKMQYYSTDTEKRIDIPLTSKNYVSDYSDDAKLGYVKFSSSDDGKKELSNFIKFLKTGYYRIYVQDKDGFDDYVQFHVGLGHQISTEIVKEEIDEEEVYIARSCKRYTIRYSEALNVYTSPNLNMSEYFMNKDYFKRYIDSKNKYQDGCPKNLGWITTSYTDRTNSNNRYTAPNGKVYFITARNGDYYSEELNKELKSTPKSFKTITELKNYIKDRNPLISMAKLGPVS